MMDDNTPLSAGREVGISIEQFSELAASAYPPLWTLARSTVRTAADAEDVVQEALMTGLNKRNQFSQGTSFLAWMGTIVRLTAMNYTRYENRRSHTPLQSIGQPVASECESDVVDPATGEIDGLQQSFDDALTDALEQLTPVARGCLMLRTQHEMDYESIGKIMNVPKNTAMSHVHRARRSMRDMLRPIVSHNTADQGGPR